MVAGTALATGCTPDTRPDVVPIALRFIPEDATEPFSELDLYREEHPFTWTFGTPKDLSWFRLALIDKEFPPTAKRAVLTSTRRMPRLFRKVRLDAGSVHAIRVVTEGLRHEFRVYWVRPGERFARDRSVAERQPSIRDVIKTYELRVATHPQWTGRITQFRLDPTALPGQKFQLHSVTGVKYFLRPEQLQAAVGRAWKLDLKQEIRSALVMPPGQSIEREIVVPKHAEFKFAYGFRKGILPTYQGTPIRFRVSIARDASVPAPLFEGTIDPKIAGSAAPGWQEGVIDLSPYAGERVRLVLETAADPSWEVFHGLPVWASLEVVYRTSRAPRAPASSGDPAQSRPAPPNLILISVDALRADHLSLYGYERATSPNIDAWARRIGVTFQNAIVQAPSTLASHVSIFTGLEAFHHRVYDGSVPSSLTTLAEILRQAGYTTAAVTGGKPVSGKRGFAQGFDRYRYWSGPGALEIIDTMHRTLEWLEDNADRPFFLFFHTFEVHSPFHARAPYASRFGADIPEGLESYVRINPVQPKATDGYRRRNRLVWPDSPPSEGGSLTSVQEASVTNVYDAAIAYADEHIGRLLDRVRELALERDTLVVLTSDHGEALGEHARVGHGYLSDDNLRVPLVLALPRRFRGGRTVSHQVRSIDILPTILELLALPPPSGVDGVSLVPLIEHDRSSDAPPPVPDAWSYAAASNFGVSLRVRNTLKYVFNNTPWDPVRGAEQLYRLDEDPEENHNLAGTSPEADRLRMRVRTMLQERPGLRVRFSNAEASPYHGTLRASFLDTAHVKTPDLPCACVTWEDGQVRFTVPPGRTYTLSLENVEPGDRSLTITLETTADQHAGPFVVDLEPEELIEPVWVAFAESAWQLIASDDRRVATGLRVWWHDTPAAGLRRQ
jgi:arylsulfatase A-like enzyme